MHQCPQKALSCGDVPGCRKITRRICMREHYVNAAESHQQLQSGEVQRLRRAIYEKVGSEDVSSLLLI